jgi:DNA-binding NarL/FixJ family response regulator
MEKVKRVPKKHGLTVLLVDDNPAIRRELSKLYLSDGFAISGEAGNGREAIDLTKKIAPDLIVLDLSMPVLNGLDAAPHLRKLAPDAAIVLLTMYPVDAVSAQALQAGADLVLSKTESSENILTKSHAAIDHRRAHHPR